MRIPKSIFILPSFISAFFLFALSAQAQNVHITVSNVRSGKGQILVAVFKNQEGFKDEKAVSKHRFPKTALSQGSLKISLELPAGTYGLALVDDENNNTKMDKNLIGVPKEGVGFSNFYLSGMSKPSFNDFKFDVKGPAVAVQCKMRYF